MLTIRCAACKRKLWKYEKIGKGEVLRCYKNLVTREFDYKHDGGKIICLCGKEIGIDKGTYIKMIRKGFIYSGAKIN